MNYVLVKKGSIKLLINDGLEMGALLPHLPEIEELAERKSDLFKDILSASESEAKAIDDSAQALMSKIGYKIIGVPFTNSDAELYALNNEIEYVLLELE